MRHNFQKRFNSEFSFGRYSNEDSFDRPLRGPTWGQDMHKIRRATVVAFTGLGLSVSMLTGCQTWMGGMTLPSPHYLEHPPQYFPEEPNFPLERELNYQEETAGLLNPRDRAGVQNPAPVPGVPVPAVPQR